MLLLGNLIGSTTVFAAQNDAFVFDTPEQEKSFNKLSNELRCLVCQNQAISDSNADLAQDLRAEIHSMLLEGKSEKEIITFMVERYGDYVLYRPPFKPLTWLLWFGPVVVFTIGLFFVRRFIREHSTEDITGELTDEEVERVRNLQSEIDTLDRKDADSGKSN
jgi:cytochrome c-type biogenesis protein CcmH